MNSEFQNSFKVIGIALRTNNKEAFQQGTIKALWGRFASEQVFTQIPHKLDTSVIALYKDYSSDKDGDFQITIGARVSSLNTIPQGMVGYEIPASERALFETTMGYDPSNVVNQWKSIWSMEDSGLLKRSYLADYELYNQISNDPFVAQVTIAIALQSPNIN